MSNYKIYNKRNKWVLEHMYSAAIYKREFRSKRLALFVKWIKDKGEKR